MEEQDLYVRVLHSCSKWHLRQDKSSVSDGPWSAVLCLRGLPCPNTLQIIEPEPDIPSKME